jgi:hypothetical protein
MTVMPSPVKMPVPNRLRDNFRRWDSAGRPDQPGTRWSRRSWLATLPDYEELLAGLPDQVDRATVAQYGSRASNGEDEALRAFVAAMVWGHGVVGYGAFRTARVLRDNQDAPRVLHEVAQRVGRDGGAEAFAWFKENALRWLGVAFATKYLFFCNVPGSAPALVLDRLVRRWLRQHADCHVRLSWHVEDYRRYLDLATEWAGELGLMPAEVEYLMFADAASEDPGSQWAPPRQVRASTDVAFSDDDERAAIMEALEEAATGFAALPGDINTADSDDFERGLRQLRRIVLTHGHFG